MKKYIVWFDEEYFEDIYNTNFQFANDTNDAAESYVVMQIDDPSFVYVIEFEKAKSVIDQIKNEGFFTKEMEDEIFSKSEKFNVSFQTTLKLNKV